MLRFSVALDAINFLPASGEFGGLLMTFENSLNPDMALTKCGASSGIKTVLQSDYKSKYVLAKFCMETMNFTNFEK